MRIKLEASGDALGPAALAGADLGQYRRAFGSHVRTHAAAGQGAAGVDPSPAGQSPDTAGGGERMAHPLDRAGRSLERPRAGSLLEDVRGAGDGVREAVALT